MSFASENIRPILIVEDNPDDRAVYIRYLKKYEQEFPSIVELETGRDILDAIATHNPSLCILDYKIPGQNGLDILRKIRCEHAPDSLPVIILTALANEEMAIEMLQNGAQYYLIKNEINPARLYGAVKSALQTASLQKQLTRLAHYDSLTGLLNRSLLINRLGQAIQRCIRYDEKCAILHLDLKRFKPFNDTYGHDVGDAILKEVGNRIRQNCRASDSPARLGADEFVILLEQIEPDVCTKVAQKILEAIEWPIEVGEYKHTVEASIGISVYPDTANNADDLLKQAEEALRRAKRSDGLRFVSFSEKYKREWTRQQVLERDLPGAIANGELSLVFQPIVTTDKYLLKRLEVLTRWYREDYSIPASELMEMIDRIGLTEAFHDWLFYAAFERAAKLKIENISADICINIPANYCYSKAISHKLDAAIQQHGIDPKCVELEITESTLMLHPERSVNLLSRLHEKGFGVAVDDFGTGYSSMAYLTKLPLDTLKIDKHFFLNNMRDIRNKKVIAAVTALGHSLDLKIIAEGIESVAELALASQVGCDLLQGFYFGEPSSADKTWVEYLHSYPLISPCKLNA